MKQQHDACVLYAYTVLLVFLFFVHLPAPAPSRKHLRTKVTPEFHLTYIVKLGEIWGRDQNNKK